MLKNKLFVTIYDMVLRHENIRAIHKKLYDQTINKKEDKIVLANCLKIANQCKKLDKGKGEYYTTGIGVLADLLWKKLNNKSDEVIHTINLSSRKIEGKRKKEILNYVFAENRKIGKVFYASSSHGDSALDHKDWQGKLYVDRLAKEDEVISYARQHNLQSVQWVIGNPVWFITRPNCRHYFVAYTLDEVKNGYKVPHTEIGNKYYQTPKINEVADKLRMLEAFYKIKPTIELKNKILKYRMLIAKYKHQI